MGGNQCGECYIDGKVYILFQKLTVVLGNFESYLSFLKSTEFMALSVSKHAHSSPTLTLPAK